MTDDVDDFAGLPALEWVDVPVRAYHRRSAPFGDRAVEFVWVRAGSLVRGAKVEAAVEWRAK